MDHSTMVSRIDILDEKKTEQVVGFHRFMLKFPKNQNNPFCMIEGEDEKYYSIRVKLICGNEEPIFISCDGKRGVLETYALIHVKSEYKSGKILYFVDKDFDAPLNNPRIYETPCYSIENFYTTPEAIKSLGRNVFKFDTDDSDFKTFIRIFSVRQEEFHSATRLLNAWIMCQRDENLKGHASRVDLKNLKVRDLVLISLEEVVQNYNLQEIESHFLEALKINQETVENKSRELVSENTQQVFRGKYEIEFLCKMLQLLQEDIGKRVPVYFQRRRRVALQFYDVLSQFSAFATTPNCLTSYINSIWTESSVEVI